MPKGKVERPKGFSNRHLMLNHNDEMIVFICVCVCERDRQYYKLLFLSNILPCMSSANPKKRRGKCLHMTNIFVHDNICVICEVTVACINKNTKDLKLQILLLVLGATLTTVKQKQNNKYMMSFKYLCFIYIVTVCNIFQTPLFT
jgi:hypothetical protein